MAERWGSARQLAPRINSQPVPTSGIDSGPFLPPPRSCRARRILNQRYHALFALLHSPGQPLNAIRGLVCLQETISLGVCVGWQRIRIDHSLPSVRAVQTVHPPLPDSAPTTASPHQLASSILGNNWFMLVNKTFNIVLESKTKLTMQNYLILRFEETCSLFVISCLWLPCLQYP